jgi:hypothetical protein
MGGNRRMLKEALKLLGTIQLSSRIGCPTVNLIRRVYYPMVNTKSQRHHYFSDHRHLVQTKQYRALQRNLQSQ